MKTKTFNIFMILISISIIIGIAVEHECSIFVGIGGWAVVMVENITQIITKFKHK